MGSLKQGGAEPLQNRGPLVFYASSDIHSPKYLRLFSDSIKELRGTKPCAFILAGDIVDKSNVVAAEPVFNLIKKYIEESARIIAVFGNEEYVEYQEEFTRRYPNIYWLDDSYLKLTCNGKTIAVVGTRGALDRPTRWQQKHMPWISKLYAERPHRIASLLDEARRESDMVLLVSHYAVTSRTLIGEPRSVWPELYSKSMEKVVLEKKPDIVIHGHSHRGKPFALLDNIPVYNVALPLNKKIVKIAPRKSIIEFF
jgi:predicted phosphodiesterase